MKPKMSERKLRHSATRPKYFLRKFSVQELLVLIIPELLILNLLIAAFRITTETSTVKGALAVQRRFIGALFRPFVLRSNKTKKCLVQKVDLHFHNICTRYYRLQMEFQHVRF